MAKYNIAIEQSIGASANVLKVQGVAQNGQAVSIKAQAQGQTRIVLDGQPLNGASHQGKALRLKKAGNNLLVQIEGDVVAEVVDFYATEGATLVGDAWLPTEGLVSGTNGLVLDPSAAVVSSAASASAAAAVPGLSMPVVIAGAAGVAALGAAGGGSSAAPSNKAPVVSGNLSESATEGDKVAKTIDLLKGASDADGDALSVSGLTYKVGDTAATSTLPDGLTLSADGKTLTLDPASSAFTSLVPNQTQTITVSYTISDGKGGSVAQTATFTITGVQADTITTTGQVTAGQSAAGLLVAVFDKDGNAVKGADGKEVQAYTDADGNYSLSIPKRFAGQALSLKVTDPDAFDGKGYIDEATGESKDFSSALRSTLVLTADKDQQTAQISPLTELAARKTISEDGSISKTAQEVQNTNTAIANLFGLSDIVETAPDVVGKGDATGNTTSNDYGKALALLSGMDAINERQGAADPMAATLDRLAQAITISGGVNAQFSGADVDTLNLLSQAVAEVATTNTTNTTDTSLIDALANIALVAAKTGLTSATDKTLFITSEANLLGAGKTTTVSFRFDGTPAATDVDKLKAQLQISGGSLSDFKVTADASVYTATFTQSGSEAPKVSVSGLGFFSNELAMQLDTTAPGLSVARIEGLGADGMAKSILKAGDTVRVTLTADESVLVTGAPVLKLNVGDTVVDAAYDAAASGTRNLVFTYKIADSVNDIDGVSVGSLSLGEGVTLTDFAGNAAQLSSTYNGLAPVVDTLAPVVISQAPLDGSTVGNAGVQSLTVNFSEVVRLGAGTLTLKRGDATVQTLDIGAGTLGADGQSVSFTLPTATLTPGSYTVTASSSAFVDAAGNDLSGGLAADGWDFTVGAVTLGINKVSTDNLLNAVEAAGALALNGTLTGDAIVLQGINASDLQVWLKPAAGGVALQATVQSLASGAWSAELPNASSLTGGYIVQAFINKDTVKSSASSVIVVDRAAQMAWGKVAGDDAISLLEQSIVKSGKTIALPFAAEKGASGTVTLTNGDKTVTKTFSNATGTADAASLTLSAADLADLGTGTINLSAVVTDVAGNQATVAKTFSIAAPAEAAKVTAVQLSGSNATTQALGDKVLATVTFDKALALSGSDLDLSLQVGGNTRTAKFVGLSADRRSLNFEYTVQTGDTDTDGVALATTATSNALRVGSSVTLKGLSGEAVSPAWSQAAQGTVKVDAEATAKPDLDVSVVEAGVNASGTFMPGTSSFAGKLVTTNGETVKFVKFGENASDVPVPAGSTASLGAAVVQGKYGTWRVGANGSYTYSLNNNDTDTQALAAGATATDVLTFVSSADTSSKQLTVTVTGTNDAPTVTAALTQATTEGSPATSIDLLDKAADVDGDTLSVSNITYKVGAGAASNTLPAGLSLGTDGKTLSLDPANAAFNSLKAGATQTITASYNVTDGQGGSVAQTATFTVTGTNDAPTVSAALRRTAAEGSTATSINLLTYAADVDGDTLSVSGITYTVGTGIASTTLPAGLSLIGTSVLSLDPSNTAFNSLKAGVTQTITASYNVTDGQGGSVPQTATFTVTGTNDAPIVSAALSQSATEGSSSVSLDLLTNATDPDANTTLSVADITYKVGDGAASSSLPAGLTLNGNTLSLDPANAAFSSLKAGATQTIIASYSVTDGNGGSVPQTATFTVTGTNDAPTAVGSVDAQTAVKAQPYSLDVSSYFVDVDAGDTRSYALSGAGATGLSIDASGKITGTLNETRDAQDLTVTLTDGSGATASQTINLRVVDKPVVQSIALAPSQSAFVPGGSTVQLALTLSQAVTLSDTSGTNAPTLTLNINGQTTTATYQSGSGSNTLVFSATVPSADGSAISISATNLPTGTSIRGTESGQDLLTTAVGQSTTALTIDSTNPLISSTALSVAENATTIATLSATDATALTWALAEGGTDNDLFSLSELGVLTLKAAKNYETDAKTYSVKVQATDAAGNTSSQTLTVNLTDVNEAPTALTLTTTSLAENASTTARIKVADLAVTDDALGTNTFTFDGADRAAFEVEGGALYLKAGTALDFETKASYSVTVYAQDTGVVGSQPVSQNFTLTISDVNDAPTVSAALSQSATEGSSSVSLDLLTNATDPDADTTLSAADITYKVGTGEASSSLPAGLTLNGNTLSLDPANAAFSSLKAGATQTITASYNVTDGQGGSVPQTATFTVTGTNDVPIAVGSVEAQTAVKAQPYSLDVSSYFGDVDAGDTRSYALSGAGATGLSIDASGKITGTLNETRDAQELTVTLTDGSGATASQTFNLRVVDKPVVQSIALAPSQSAFVPGGSTVQLALTLSQAVTVSGEGVPTLTLNINGQTTTATYQSGSGTNTLVFSATVPSTDGNALSISAINLPAGTSIRGTESGQDLLTTAVGQSTTALTIDGTNPVISSAALSVAENATTIATLSATDATALTWALAEGGTDNDLFSLSELGVLTLKAAKNYETDAKTYSVKVQATDAAGNSSSQTLTVNLTNPSPTASTVASDAPSAYDRGAVSGATADSVRVRFSESVNGDLLQQAMLEGKITLQGANGETRSLGSGAVFEALAPSELVVTGLSAAANGTYTSLWTGEANSEVPTFAAGFGLTTASNANVDTKSTIYKKTNADGSVWYIWTQAGEGQWVISQNDPAGQWYLSNISLSATPAQRSGVLGVSRWNMRSGALAQGEDPWATATVVAGADLEPNGSGSRFVLALGAGHTAQAGDTLVIDKSFVKSKNNLVAESDIRFTLPSDITRPGATAAASVQGFAADGTQKTTPLAAGDVVRVTVQMTEAVSVSGSSAAVTLELDATSKLATINKSLSFANGASTSNTLVFDYVVKDGDFDGVGGISVGALNRNGSTIRDAAGNRLYASTELQETANTVSIAADSKAPTLASVASADKGILSGVGSDTMTFRFDEFVKVDTLEAAFASGQVKVTSADGTVRELGAGARVEATYPSAMNISGFSTAADGNYTSLWSPAESKNKVVPSFTGFSTGGITFQVDVHSPIYQHTDSAGQQWYLWRPAGWSNYLLTPESSVIGNAPQSWWAGSNGTGTGTADIPREGVLLVGEWYANSGQLSSSQSAWRGDTKLSAQPALEASGWGVTFTLALGTGHTVQQGDTLSVGAGAAVDASGNANTAALTVSLPADMTRPLLGEAIVKGMVLNSATNSYSEVPSNQDLGQGNLIRVEIPVSEAIRLYYTGYAESAVALDIGGQTRYAWLNMPLSSANGSTASGFTSNKLVYEYFIQAGDTDTQGGITVGAMYRGNVGMYDAAGNRPLVPSDVAEAANTLRIVDNAAPSIWLSYASSTTLVLKASEPLDTSHLPGTSAFAVTVGGQAVAVNSVAAAPGDPYAVVLTLASAAAVNQSVLVSYTDPTANNDTSALQDLTGNDVVSFQNSGKNATAVPTLQYAQAGTSMVELANGSSELWFHLQYSDTVAISGTPRLALTLKDGNTTSTVYADYQPYQNVTNGQTSVSFMYKPQAGAQGQVHVSSIDLNGGSITAWGSAGTVPVSTTLAGSEFFTPYTWIYPSASTGLAGDAGNNLLAPWMQSPENTPKTLTSTTVDGGAGDRDVLLMSVLLPASVQTGSAAMAYQLDYNVTTDGVRQVLLKNGSAVVDTYTLPANTEWPAGVEQIMFHAVYKDASNAVQFSEVGNLLLTKQTAEYVDPVDANAIWLQGTLDADNISVAGRSVDQRIYIDAAQGNDTIVGHDGTDLINGGGGTNAINAGAGNDVVMVRNGNQDLVDGGTGTDTLRFDLPGHEKKITVDAAGTIHVYSASGTWNGSFTPDAKGWVERYRLSTDYGTDGSNRLAVFDVARDRVVASAKNMEQLQWRLDDNVAGRATNKFAVGSAGNDTLSGADVVLAGAGDDTIILTDADLHTYDWHNGHRALLIDGGAGRDVLQLNTFVGGQLNQVFEWISGSNINSSRVLQNIEGLTLTQGAYVQLAAADIANLVGSNTNAWGGAISGLDATKKQFLVTATYGSLNLTDTAGWTQKTSTVSYNSLSYKLLEHTSGVQLLLDSRANANGAINYEDGSGSGASYTITSDTSYGQINEGNSGSTTVNFTVVRSGVTTGATSVNWTLVNYGTNASDFMPGQAMAGSVSFAAGETSKTIAVQVQGDTLTEQDENFAIRLSQASNGSSAAIVETQVIVRNDDGSFTAPVVKLVRSQDNQYVFPGDEGARFTVEMSEAVRITGTPQLRLTLTSLDGTETRTAVASFQRYGNTGDMVQSTMEFVYDYSVTDFKDAGWQVHINSLELPGATITHSANSTISANLQLNRVAITAGDWLIGTNSVVKNSATGTAYNDVILPWDSDPASAPTSLSASSTFNNVAIQGGAGDRDVLGIPFMLPAEVTTQALASQYYLSYASNSEGTVRTVSLYKSGEGTAIKVFTVPNFSNSQSINDWPTEIEAMAFYIQYRDAAANENRGVSGPGGFLELWKNGFTSTDAVNGDVYRQGSFRGDDLNFSTTAADKRVLVKAGFGSDTITGHAGVDVILGEGGSDTIDAGAGDDLVWLSGGTDTINGGDGTDALGMHLHGAAGRGWVDASHRLHIQSGNGGYATSSTSASSSTTGTESTSSQFVPDASGYTSDWVLSFDQTTGDIAAKRFAGGVESSETSTATGMEALYFTFENSNQTGGGPLVRGSASADTLVASQSENGLLLGLGGNDTFVVDSPSSPFMMGGDGDDTFRIMSVSLVNSEGMQVHGGAGRDTFALGSDVSGSSISKPTSSYSQGTSLEVVDLTGSTASGALGNTLQLTAAWMREFTDLIEGASRNLVINGDANDKLSLLSADNWSLQDNSSQLGYAQYSATVNSETLNIFVADAIKNASGGVIVA